MKMFSKKNISQKMFTRKHFPQENIFTREHFPKKENIFQKMRTFLIEVIFSIVLKIKSFFNCL